MAHSASLFRSFSVCFFFFTSDRQADLKRLQSAYDDVDTALLFIGYPRSRHTLVSALMDAHPNIMLANELNMIAMYKSHPEWSKNDMFDKLAAHSIYLATQGRRAQTTEGNASSYLHLGYRIPNQWQGTFDHTLTVTYLFK